MIRASRLFTEADRQAISTAVAQAEARTAGEIVPIVATASGRYPAAAPRAGMLGGLGLLAATWIAFEGPAGPGLPVLLGGLLAGYALGAAAAAGLPVLRRALASPREREDSVHAAARAALSTFRVRRTREATGVVLYVSLLERLVVVAADDAVEDQVDEAAFDPAADAVLSGLRAGEPARALADGIRLVGEVLARHFPIRPDDVNELSNELRLID
jgi:putative membrane protein